MFEERGLVRVTFHPGVERTKVIKTLQNSREHWHPEERGRGSFKNLSLHDSDEATWDAGTLGGGPSASMADNPRGATKSKSHSLSYEIEGIASMDAVPMGAMRGTGDYISGRVERKSGITGLSGASSQRFDKTTSLPEYDEAHITEINLRLVAIEEQRVDPTPLRPITRRTPVPPPVYLI